MITCIALSIYLLIGIVFGKKEMKENEELLSKIEKNRYFIRENRRRNLFRKNEDTESEFNPIRDHLDKQIEMLHMKAEEWASEIKQTEYLLGKKSSDNLFFTIGVLFWLPIIVGRKLNKF